MVHVVIIPVVSEVLVASFKEQGSCWAASAQVDNVEMKRRDTRRGLERRL